MLLFDTLSNFGITSTILQVIIIACVAIVLIGIYWRIVAIGAGILTCAVVFAMPSNKAPTSLDQPNKAIVKPEDKVPEEFLTDCQLYNETTRTQCELIWKERS
jgi:hypothetical protein